MDQNFKWGEIKLEKLPKEIDLQQLKQARTMLIEEPLLNINLNYTMNNKNSLENKKKNFKKY